MALVRTVNTKIINRPRNAAEPTVNLSTPNCGCEILSLRLRDQTKRL